MIQRISIDGACRRNGKPNCISAGGVFVQLFNEDLVLVRTETLSNYELQSTNQRGEMLALLTALDHVLGTKIPAQIITDSEYLFNSVTKEWFNTWAFNDWLTAAGEPVKNKDIWQQLATSVKRCQEAGIDVNCYHIKGHCIPFGKVTAATALARDASGMELYKLVSIKFDEVDASNKRLEEMHAARVLSEKNNGFRLNDKQLKDFVVSNIVADAVATKCVEAADAL